MEINIILTTVLSVVNLLIFKMAIKTLSIAGENDQRIWRKSILDNMRELKEIKELLFVIAGDKIESSQWGAWNYKEIPKGDWGSISPGDPYWRYQDCHSDTKSKSYYQINIDMLKEEIKREKDEEEYVKSLRKKIDTNGNSSYAARNNGYGQH